MPQWNIPQRALLKKPSEYNFLMSFNSWPLTAKFFDKKTKKDCLATGTAESIKYIMRQLRKGYQAEGKRWTFTGGEARYFTSI